MSRFQLKSSFYRDPKPIVLPEWVTDSIKAGQLLPVNIPHMFACCCMVYLVISYEQAKNP